MEFERGRRTHQFDLAPANRHLVRATVVNKTLARLMRARRFHTLRLDGAKRAVMYATGHEKHDRIQSIT